MDSHLFASVLVRLKLLMRTQTDVQLARALDISPQTLSSWKVRDSIPYSLCVDLARQHDCSLDWLLLGKGTLDRPAEPDSSWENNLLERMRDLPQADRQSVLLHVQDKQRIRQLEQALQELAMRLPSAPQN